MRTARFFASLSLAAFGCGEASRATDCYGVCGRGTQCESERCVPLPAPVDDEPATKGKRSTRRKGRSKGSDRTGSTVPDNLPPHDPNRTRVLGEGSERLADDQVHKGLAREQDAFNACLAAAAETRELGHGSIEFSFSIDPSGRVTGISASAPEQLRVPGLLPCLKKVIYDHRFPSWQGPEMDAEYRFRVQ